ncbi:MAG TPA: Glu/Leu/Phe/Val dehydrogenase dimerization domain-containing protein, partial [Erysipelothrix sp.]|nr:Glu/Leu/Phe/Val dehydrogenase dimerization domain-containing protein [Erysipelothrix sp.]
MKKILEVVQNKAPHEVLFNNATSEFVDTMKSYLDESVLKVLLHPNRTHIFSVPWVDGSGKTQVNTGYRVQYSLAMGPYKGGIRFDPSVNLDVMKFLAFEQTFKNALTGLAMGGAKGGADFDPKGKTDAEILSFCQSFINQVYQHLGAHTDVPAGDIGVGAREVGYMYGQYKMLTQTHAGVFTGKSPVFGGALGRPEATGYGLIYITDALLKEHNDSFKDKRVIISGSGNVAIHAAYKAVEKGAKVVAMSDRTGYVYDDNGLDIASIQAHKDSKEALKTYTKSTYIYDHSIWNVPCDIALPCATQSEIDDKDMKALLINGVKIVAEGANRPLTPEAVNRIQASEAYYLPGKAANAGGVAVSGLEM